MWCSRILDTGKIFYYNTTGTMVGDLFYIFVQPAAASLLLPLLMPTTTPGLQTEPPPLLSTA